MNNFKKLSAVHCILSAMIVFLLMNLLTPNLTDDYAYSFVWDGEHDGNFQNDIGDLQRIESFADIFISQYSHWLTWGGRTVAHIFVQFFAWQGKLLFDFANAVMFAILALELYFLGKGEVNFKNLDAKILVVIFFALWFCLPEFFQTTLWMTGSCNYLWMAVFQFAFLIPFALKFWNDKFKISTALTVPLGLLAGWSNEAGSAMILFVTFFAIIYFKRKKKLETWMLAGFFAAFVGFALLMLAPGNFHREEIDTEEGLTFFDILTDNFLYGFLPVMIGNLILILPIILYFLRGKKSLQTSLYIFAFAVTGIFLPCLLMIAPYFPARAAFDSPIFLLVAAIVALKNISINLPKKFFYFVGIFWTATIFYALAVDFSVHEQISDRQEYISAHKHDEVITVQPIILPSMTEKFFWVWTMDEEARFYNDLTPYMRINRNKITAKHFGVKNIVADEATWKHLQDLNQLPLYDD